MNGAAILAAAFPALLIVGVLLSPLLVRRGRSARRSAGGVTTARPKANQDRADTEIPMVRPRSAAGGDRYFAKWSALQARFNEEPVEPARQAAT